MRSSVPPVADRLSPARRRARRSAGAIRPSRPTSKARTMPRPPLPRRPSSAGGARRARGRQGRSQPQGRGDAGDAVRAARRRARRRSAASAAIRCWSICGRRGARPASRNCRRSTRSAARETGKMAVVAISMDMGGDAQVGPFWKSHGLTALTAYTDAKNAPADRDRRRRAADDDPLRRQGQGGVARRAAGWTGRARMRRSCWRRRSRRRPVPRDGRVSAPRRRDLEQRGQSLPVTNSRSLRRRPRRCRWAPRRGSACRSGGAAAPRRRSSRSTWPVFGSIRAMRSVMPDVGEDLAVDIFELVEIGTGLPSAVTVSRRRSLSVVGIEEAQRGRAVGHDQAACRRWSAPSPRPDSAIRTARLKPSSDQRQPVVVLPGQADDLVVPRHDALAEGRRRDRRPARAHGPVARSTLRIERTAGLAGALVEVAAMPEQALGEGAGIVRIGPHHLRRHGRQLGPDRDRCEREQQCEGQPRASVAQQLVDRGLGAGLRVDALDDHRAIERRAGRAVGQRLAGQRAGHDHRIGAAPRRMNTSPVARSTILVEAPR